MASRPKIMTVEVTCSNETRRKRQAKVDEQEFIKDVQFIVLYEPLLFNDDHDTEANVDEPELFKASIACLGDVSRGINDLFIPYSDDFIPLVLQMMNVFFNQKGPKFQ